MVHFARTSNGRLSPLVHPSKSAIIIQKSELIHVVPKIDFLVARDPTKPVPNNPLLSIAPNTPPKWARQ
jgi:hypothetical protein